MEYWSNEDSGIPISFFKNIFRNLEFNLPFYFYFDPLKRLSSCDLYLIVFRLILMYSTKISLSHRRIVMLYAGIDLHKYFLVISVINQRGSEISSIRINNDAKLLVNYFSQFTEPIKIVIEATLNWYWVVDLLDQLQFEIVLAHPKRLRAIVETKYIDDKISSNTLAQLLRNDYIPEVYYLSQEIRALRDLCRTRLFLVRQRTALINNCSSNLLKYNIRAPEIGKLHSSNGLAFLRDDELPIHEISKFEMTCKTNIIEKLNENIQLVEIKIREQNQEDNITKRLKTISGIGDILSSTIRYEVGVMSRFFNDKRFSSYCRFTPRMHVSGKSAKYYKTSKEGNAYLKWAFSEVAVCAIKYDADTRKHYQRKKSKKGKPIALSIIGRNMTTVVYHVWTTSKDYRGYKKKVLTKNVN